jgi:glycosyltransferase 2 family protein
VHLQYAIKFVGLAISATAGRVGMNTAFLRKFGEGPTVAVAASALDSMAGAVVNVVIVLLTLVLGGLSSDELTFDVSGVTRTAITIVAVAVACAVLVAVVPALRRRAVEVIRHAWAAFETVAESPSRLLGLFGTNLASLLITAMAMSCMVRGMHYSLSYWTVVAVCAGSGLLSAIIPVPGNIGVAEAAMTAGLGIAGIPEAPAFAIAVTQRIATTYLPSVFGTYSLRWLRAKEYA